MINRLGTSSYKQFASWMGVPVGTSRSEPRDWPSIDRLPDLTPTGLAHLKTEFEFEIVYRERLNAKADHLRNALELLSDKYPGRRLVLLCWENISRPGEWCHRRIAAEWLQEHGVCAPEIDAINPLN